MIQYKRLAMLITAAALCTPALPAQELFRVKFQATCRPGDNGNNQSTKMNARDLIAECVGSGFTKKDLDRNFALVYNATADSLQVVNEADSSLVCDVFQFQNAAANVVSGNGNNDRLERLVFVFRPNETNSIGSAVISEKTPHNTGNRARINGKIQFTMATSTLTAARSNAGSNAGSNDGSNSSNNSGDTNNVSTNSFLGNLAGLTNNLTGNSGMSNDSNNNNDSSNDNNNASRLSSFVQAAVVPAVSAEAQICTGTFSAGRAFQPGGNNQNNNNNLTSRNRGNDDNSNTADQNTGAGDNTGTGNTSGSSTNNLSDSSTNNLTPF